MGQPRGAVGAVVDGGPSELSKAACPPALARLPMHRRRLIQVRSLRDSSWLLLQGARRGARTEQGELRGPSSHVVTFNSVDTGPRTYRVDSANGPRLGSVIKCSIPLGVSFPLRQVRWGFRRLIPLLLTLLLPRSSLPAAHGWVRRCWERSTLACVVANDWRYPTLECASDICSLQRADLQRAGQAQRRSKDGRSSP